jgi:hypothetical protein
MLFFGMVVEFNVSFQSMNLRPVGDTAYAGSLFGRLGLGLFRHQALDPSVPGQRRRKKQQREHVACEEMGFSCMHDSITRLLPSCLLFPFLRPILPCLQPFIRFASFLFTSLPTKKAAFPLFLSFFLSFSFFFLFFVFVFTGRR